MLRVGSHCCLCCHLIDMILNQSLACSKAGLPDSKGEGLSTTAAARFSLCDPKVFIVDEKIFCTFSRSCHLVNIIEERGARRMCACEIMFLDHLSDRSIRDRLSHVRIARSYR